MPINLFVKAGVALVRASDKTPAADRLAEMIDQDVTIAEEVARDKRAALTYLAEAFAEAELDGLDSDCMVQAALFAAFRHLCDVYGEEATAIYAETFPTRIRAGAFSTHPRH